ncbi:MAG: antibiotic biosynthesis monooxygenase family protein [Flavobacteriaceae bacterium]
MLIRIVKLTIREENISNFEQIFEKTKNTIRGFEGCGLLELYKDRDDPKVFFTYSRWNSEEDLEAYRQSDFFKNVWGKTKLLFEAKPEAWSVDSLASLK